ncbi:hypothetical protein CLOBOL_01457 [Enterocloster bolteae ATCC BAA-613]|uniref:Uncharacterized protein n=1 Tax=Enterocloster bolteae (strain ATCC BAA-613 / DSM 15670 / CCUG 46953 / JCM 12243 / WAL 16351) TaxID=411902 RepID=A8RKZ5_ENTBW|nr:hypothetical protein CLOBOL_01457 [Enterocloster bolteae ATCC BAA-613]
MSAMAADTFFVWCARFWGRRAWAAVLHTFYINYTIL